MSWNDGKEPVDVPYDEIVRETETCVVFRIDDREIPVNYSCIVGGRDAIDEDNNEAPIQRWLVEKEGLD